MSFRKGLISGLIVLAGSSGVAQAAGTGSSEPYKYPKETNLRHMEAQAQAQPQSKTKVPAPTPAADQGPSNIERVNRALNPGPSDPDVPLPRADLAGQSSGRQDPSSGGPLYGRQEQGGGVLGFRMPIPADRSAPGAGTRSSTP